MTITNRAIIHHQLSMMKSIFRHPPLPAWRTVCPPWKSFLWWMSSIPGRAAWEVGRTAASALKNSLPPGRRRRRSQRRLLQPPDMAQGSLTSPASLWWKQPLLTSRAILGAGRLPGRVSYQFLLAARGQRLLRLVAGRAASLLSEGHPTLAGVPLAEGAPLPYLDSDRRQFFAASVPDPSTHQSLAAGPCSLFLRSDQAARLRGHAAAATTSTTTTTTTTAEFQP